MFRPIDTRSNAGPGPFTSFVIHVTVIALMIAFSAAIHKVVIQPSQAVMVQFKSKARPAVMVTHKSLERHSLGTPALVTAGAPVIARVRHEAAQPMLVKLDMPSTMELPQGNAHTVAMAPQAKAAGFGGTVAVGSPGPSGTVAGAGFGQVGTGSGHSTGKVATGGFTASPAPTQVAIKTSEPSYVLPVVTAEPHPMYTEAAVQAHVQGEVILQVRFTAAGTVEVLRVVSGLGFGLDEQAKRVIEGIRFKPATRDGAPVDHTTLIHVTFQLG